MTVAGCCITSVNVFEDMWKEKSIHQQHNIFFVNMFSFLKVSYTNYGGVKVIIYWQY